MLCVPVAELVEQLVEQDASIIKKMYRYTFKEALWSFGLELAKIYLLKKHAKKLANVMVASGNSAVQ